MASESSGGAASKGRKAGTGNNKGNRTAGNRVGMRGLQKRGGKQSTLNVPGGTGTRRR